MLPRRCVTLVALCLVLALLPAAAQAAPTLSPRSQLVRPGQLVKLRATVPVQVACGLRVDTRRFSLAANATRNVTISARVSPRARRGAHSLSLRCSSQRVRTRVVVARSAGNRRARGQLFRGRVRIRAQYAAPAEGVPETSDEPPPSTPFPRSVLPASPQAQLWWQANVLAIVTSFRNGQCTDWAQQRRPDVVQSAYMRRFDLLGPIDVVTSWDAKYWAVHAAQAGLPVRRAPVVGAIMTFQPGSFGAGSAGHVSVVESVAGNGAFTTSAMHAPDVGSVTRQSYGATTAAQMAADPGIAFIH